MILICARQAYLYDRKNKFYMTDCIFLGDYDFMFDGEMYLENGKYIYSIFDCLIYDSKPRTELNLNRRLGYCFKFKKTIDKGFFRCKKDTSFEVFEIIAKDMFK